MSAPLTLYLVRHGEVYNPQQILYGRLPNFYLSDTGKAQAQAAGQWLSDKPLAAVYSSPMERAQETAGYILAARTEKIRLQTEDRLIETLTPHEGRFHHELQAANYDMYSGIEPPYEQPQDLRRRLLDFIAEMRRTHAGQTIAAVSHGDIVVVGFLFAKQQPENSIGRGELEALGLPERYPATASISILTYHTTADDEVPEYAYVKPYN
jgi:broad specificity phosphatase PhoE